MVTQDPEFWNDPKKAEVVLKSIKNKKLWVSSYDNLKTNLEDTEVLFQFFKEGEIEEVEIIDQYQLLLKNLDDLELKNMLSFRGGSFGCNSTNYCWSWRDGKL